MSRMPPLKMADVEKDIGRVVFESSPIVDFARDRTMPLIDRLNRYFSDKSSDAYVNPFSNVDTRSYPTVVETIKGAYKNMVESYRNFIKEDDTRVNTFMNIGKDQYLR